MKLIEKIMLTVILILGGTHLVDPAIAQTMAIVVFSCIILAPALMLLGATTWFFSLTQTKA